ncbi:MAG: MarR family transcriptional regulator [Hadesarchaea archaeon]|nr:MarR family transcriptional regulator [Hadesarchaea archaeon]
MLTESNTQKVLAFIFKYPTKGFTVRAIARAIKISPPTVSNILEKLEKEGLVKIVEEEVQHKTYGNFESEYFRDLKRIYNIFSLYGLKHLLIQEFRPNAIVVYGAYARGEDREDSDVDIYVDSTIRKGVNLKAFEKELARRIHLIVRSAREIPNELKRNLVNGVILYGVIE